MKPNGKTTRREIQLGGLRLRRIAFKTTEPAGVRDHVPGARIVNERSGSYGGYRNRALAPCLCTIGRRKRFIWAARMRRGLWGVLRRARTQGIQQQRCDYQYPESGLNRRSHRALTALLHASNQFRETGNRFKM